MHRSLFNAATLSSLKQNVKNNGRRKDKYIIIYKKNQKSQLGALMIPYLRTYFRPNRGTETSPCAKSVTPLIFSLGFERWFIQTRR